MDTKLGIAMNRTVGVCGAGPESSHSTEAGSCGHVLSQVEGGALYLKFRLALGDACTDESHVIGV